MEDKLFGWLVRYQIEQNLPRAKSHMVNGVVHGQDGVALEEGGKENKYYPGFLVITNHTPLEKLVAAEVMEPEDVEEFIPLHSYSELSDYFNNQDSEGRDGAYIVDHTKQGIARVCEYHNGGNLDYARFLPDDFVSLSKDKTADRQNLGTKTRVAVKLPVKHDVETYQIKQTPYGNTGIGKVTHFGNDGLVEEFFFMHAPESKGPFIDAEKRIVGVYRRYEGRNENDRPKMAFETTVSYDGDSFSFQ